MPTTGTADLVAHGHRSSGNFRLLSVRQHQPGWHYWHACCRSRVAIAFLRCVDRKVVHIKHFIYSLNVDTGATNPGWPVDLNNAGIVIYFVGPGRPRSTGSGKRHCLRAVFRTLGRLRELSWLAGRRADGQPLHRWWLGPRRRPKAQFGGLEVSPAMAPTRSWLQATLLPAHDGIWGGGEAIIRLQAGPMFSDSPNHYWAPTDWLTLDDTDADLGGWGAILIDVPGRNPFSTWFSPWARMATPIWLTVTTWEASRLRWPSSTTLTV